ncbi:MAG TPA: hypothetical protein VIY86_09715, partial [Pirellulaceae bacterium]
GFDFTTRMSELCRDIVARVPDLRHIQMDRIAVCFAQNRKPVAHGIWASLTPLRFTEGAEETLKEGRRFVIQRVLDAEGRPMLYILRFYLPRFLDLSFRESLTTIMHELWHVSPTCDGDIRRYPGRFAMHSPRKYDFDAQAEALADSYLKSDPPESLLEFLSLDCQTLFRQHGGIHGQRIRQPRLFPLDRKR